MLDVMNASEASAGWLPEPDDAAAALYRLLMRGGNARAASRFDLHVIACILSLAFWEAVREQRPLPAAVGLGPNALAALIDEMFPEAAYLFPALDDVELQRSADEVCLLDLLGRCTTDGSPFQARLAAMIARRAQQPDHLWQDLGLRDRGELSLLMARHFRLLAARNAGDMKWKKFLYRMICRDAGYTLCTAPSCSECTDFEACFGEESGESRLALARRATERGA